MNSDSIQFLILEALKKETEVVSTNITELSDESLKNVLFGAIKSLSENGKIEFETLEKEDLRPTLEGKSILSTGSHEWKVVNAVSEAMPDGLTTGSLKENFGTEVAQLGQNFAIKNKWICVKEGKLYSTKDSIQYDTTVESLEKIVNGESLNENIIKELRRRKLVETTKLISYRLKRGSSFFQDVVKPILELTPSMLISGSWRGHHFKQYNFDADGPVTRTGHLHPLLKLREEFRQIFFDMGFSEMPTNRYVESSFWNFDALFVPQQHPARDSQDTFFVADPSTTSGLPNEYIERVSEMHKWGDSGSIGYRTSFSVEETMKNVLRTHTTAITARMLYQLAKERPFRPKRYFSIDRVFRNETVDATHLAEFHQIEGVVADYNLTLGDLIGTLSSFFKKLGMENLRFKPTYNPYTEPSMEIFSFHEGLGRWIEVGNTGIFRPEVLGPMGLDPKVRVIAWGLSLERPAMIKYKIDNIRDLVGHKVDLNMVYQNPICRLDKMTI